jgi:hypothetical protein
VVALLAPVVLGKMTVAWQARAVQNNMVGKQLVTKLQGCAAAWGQVQLVGVHKLVQSGWVEGRTGVVGFHNHCSASS